MGGGSRVLMRGGRDSRRKRLTAPTRRPGPTAAAQPCTTPQPLFLPRRPAPSCALPSRSPTPPAKPAIRSRRTALPLLFRLIVVVLHRKFLERVRGRVKLQR